MKMAKTYYLCPSPNAKHVRQKVPQILLNHLDVDTVIVHKGSNNIPKQHSELLE